MAGLKGITINTAPETEPHIYAEDDAAIYQSIFGPDGVTTIGQQCKATTLSNNKVRISDGVVIVGGHVARIPYGEYEDCEIANGQSGKKRNDIIIGKIVTTGSGGIDTMTCEVKQGVAGTSATDPILTQDNIYQSGKIREIPLYRVKIEGLSIVAVEKMFKTISSIPELEEMLTELNSKIDPYRVIDFGTTGRTTYVKYANGVMIQYGIASVSYTDGYGTATFASPFIDTSYAFFTTGAYVNSGYPMEVLTCQKVSNSKAYIYSRNLQGNKVETHSVDWLAIGKWK